MAMIAIVALTVEEEATAGHVIVDSYLGAAVDSTRHVVPDATLQLTTPQVYMATLAYCTLKQNNILWFKLTYRFNSELTETKSLNNHLLIKKYCEYNSFKLNKFNLFDKTNKPYKQFLYCQLSLSKHLD